MFVVTVLPDCSKELLSIISLCLWKKWYLCKASAVSDAIRPGCSEMGGVNTDACVNRAKTIDDNGPGGTKGEVDIVRREKQIDANSEIYYVMHLNKNGTLTTPNKTNKTLILISS